MPSDILSPVGRITGAAALYFLIVFGVGFLLGPIRVLWLEPELGSLVATLCEAPFLVVAMLFSALWITRALGVQTPGERIAMGQGALALVVAADFTVGLALRNKPVAEQVAYLTTPAGGVYLALLVVFASVPAMLSVPLNRS